MARNNGLENDPEIVPVLQFDKFILHFWWLNTEWTMMARYNGLENNLGIVPIFFSWLLDNLILHLLKIEQLHELCDQPMVSTNLEKCLLIIMT